MQRGVYVVGSLARTCLAPCMALLVVFTLGACGAPASTMRPTSSPVWTAPSGATSASAPAAPGDWTRFGYDAARSGVNPTETGLSPTNVSALHRLWQIRLPGVADSSPILLHAMRLPDGTTRDLLYVTTRDGRLLALDAANGSLLWSKQPKGPKITHSSPIADPARQYIYAYGLDGSLHKYRATTGEEIIGSGWPALITRMRQSEKEGSALNMANGYLYVTTGGYIGDAPPYQGHIVTIALADGSERVFNSLCSNVTRLLTANDCSSEESGIWSRAGAVVDPITGDVFAATGNGPYNANSGGHDYSDSILELSADGAHLLDSYTPATYQDLQNSDTDLGSTAPALLPTIANAKHPYLLVQSGKDNILRLLDRQNLSGAGGPGHIGGELQTIDLGCGVFSQPAVWVDTAGQTWVFVATTCALHTFRVMTDGAGATTLRPIWSAEVSATSPTLAGGVLYVASNQGLVGFAPQTGKRLWSSQAASAGGNIGAIHWESPIVIGGRLYCADESGHLTAYGAV